MGGPRPGHPDGHAGHSGLGGEGRSVENARQNSDRENARVESDKATERPVLAMVQDNTQLFKLFADNPDFRRWLADTALRLAYEATR